MKKTLIFIISAAMLVSSCIMEKIFGGTDDVHVRFALELDNGVLTRASGDAPVADKLYYAVFDDEGVLIDAFKARSKPVASYPTSVDVQLTKGQTYTVVFWAQNSQCDAYTVNEDLTVDVSYSGPNNDASRDAFFGKRTITVGSAANNHDVLLTRPFAQLNVGVTEADLAAAAKTDVVVDSSAVSVSGISDKFNALTGAATGSVKVEYEFGAVPTDMLSANGNRYGWLSMSYLLVDGMTTGTVVFTFDPDDDSKAEIVISEGLSNVPLQRNWRTNILGNLLTGNVSFDVSLDEEFENDNNISFGPGSGPGETPGGDSEGISFAFGWDRVVNDDFGLSAYPSVTPSDDQRTYTFSAVPHGRLEFEGYTEMNDDVAKLMLQSHIGDHTNPYWPDDPANWTYTGYGFAGEYDAFSVTANPSQNVYYIIAAALDDEYEICSDVSWTRADVTGLENTDAKMNLAVADNGNGSYTYTTAPEGAAAEKGHIVTVITVSEMEEYLTDNKYFNKDVPTYAEDVVKKALEKKMAEGSGRQEAVEAYLTTDVYSRQGPTTDTIAVTADSYVITYTLYEKSGAVNGLAYELLEAKF